MYQRSPKVALRLGASCSWRWEGSSSCPLRPGQGDSVRCCHRTRLRPRDPDVSWDKLPPELLSSTYVKLTFQSPFAKKWPETPTSFPILSLSSMENFAMVTCGLKHSIPETRALLQPSVLSPRAKMEGTIIWGSEKQESNSGAHANDGLDSASFDSMYHLFHGWQDSSPDQSPEVALGPLAPFRATTGSPSPANSPNSGDRSMEDHLEAMHQKLQEELPDLFLKGHDFRIYSQDVEFINEILHVKTRGLFLYQLVLLLCRFVSWTYFVSMHLEVLKVTQHPENWSIQVRWRIRGLPFHIFLLRFYKNRLDLFRTYDAYSTFFLNSQGLIKCHRVSKLMPSQPLQNKLKNLVVASLLGLELSDQRPSLLLWLLSSEGHL